jgi:peroxin-1
LFPLSFLPAVFWLNPSLGLQILAKIIEDRLSKASDLEEDSNAPLNVTALATQTEGYSATDLQDLVARAVHQAAIRKAEHPDAKVRAAFCVGIA